MTLLITLALVGCGYDLTSPEPGLDALTPGLVCNDQLTTEVTVAGSALSPAPTSALEGPAARLPDLSLSRTTDLTGGAADAADVDLDEESGAVRWDSQSQMRFDVTPELGIAPGIYSLSVSNLDAQEGLADATVLADALAVAPPPTLTTVSDEIVCVADEAHTVTLSGEGFLSVDGALPTITVGTVTLDADAVSNCTDLAGPQAGQVCTDLDVTIPAGALDAGVYDVVVTNPAPADCASTEAIQIEVVPPPTLDGLDPLLTCGTQGDTTVTLDGSDFLVLADGTLPTVNFGDVSVTADGTDGCTSLSGPGGGQTCTSVTATLASDAVTPGLIDVTVTNPEPANCTSGSVPMDVIGAPVVATLAPAGICTDSGDVEMTVDGSSFLMLDDGTLPTATVGGQAMTVSAADACAAAGSGFAGSICDELTVSVPAGTFTTLGSTHPVVVTNPAPAECVSNDDVALEVTPPPTLTGAEPNPVCSSDDTFTLLGTDLQTGGTITLDGSSDRIASVTALGDGSGVEISLSSPLEAGFYDVGFANPDTCAATGDVTLQVVSGPLLFFVDPPVIWDGMATEQNLYVGGVTGNVTEVRYIEEATGTETVISTDDWTYDGNNTLRVTVDVPTLGLPEGTYTVALTDDSGCVSFLEGGLEVESDLNLAVTAVVEEFAAEFEYTAVDIRAAATNDLAVDEVNFADLPRVYLSPVDGGTARPLSSVIFEDETFLSAVVPDDLPAGPYDVIVVNPPPGNEIGVLFADADPVANNGLLVTAQPPPTVVSVAPNRVDAATDTEIAILGDSFRNASVSLLCQDITGTQLAPIDCAVSAQDATSVTCLVPSAGSLDEGTVCAIEVTNDDLTSTQYSAITAGSPSGNLFPWGAGLDLTTPRRAPASVAGRATERARFVYAIGGDDGTEANAYTSLEMSALDVLGNQRPWRELPAFPLPAPRTLAGVVEIDGFVYVVGGNDGTGPVDTVWRAQILSPLNVARLDNLGIAFGDGSGLDGGTWSYRIAPVYAAGDTVNPGGEGLASDPIVVRLPEIPDKVELFLDWEPVVPDDPSNGVVGYRIYRSPTPDSGSGQETFLTEVSGTSFTDDGSLTPDGTTRPLPLGQLGAWSQVATLPGNDAADAARQSPAVGVARDPLDGSVAYLYVAGGLDGNGGVRDTVSVLTIDTSATNQPVTAVADAGVTLPTPRHQAGSWVVDDSYHSVVGADETWFYVGTGLETVGRTTWSGDVDAGLVQSGGALGSWQTVNGPNTARAGYTALSANNFLYLIGGHSKGGGSNAGTLSGFEVDITTPPLLGNWNSLGSSVLTESRDLPGSAIESAIVFSIGGADTNGAALSTVDVTNF